MSNSQFRSIKASLIISSLLIFQAPLVHAQSAAEMAQLTGDDAELTSIVVNAVAVVSSRLGSYEKAPADVEVGATAGLVFSNSEAETTVLTQQTSDELAQKVAELNQGVDASSAQGQGYFTLYEDSYTNAISSLTLKKYGQDGAATTYAMAAELALLMSKKEEKAMDKCQTALVDTAKACGPATDSVDNVDKVLKELIEARDGNTASGEGSKQTKSKRDKVNSKVKEVKSKLSEASTQFQSEAAAATAEENFPEAESLQEKAGKCTEAMPHVNACEELLNLLEEGEAYGEAPKVSFNSYPNIISPLRSKISNHYLADIINFLLPEANAIDIMAFMGENMSAASYLVRPYDTELVKERLLDILLGKIS